MENEESNLNAGRRGPKNNGVGNYVHSPRSNVILMHFEDFFNLILIINLGDQMLVPQVNNHKLSMGLSFISSFIYFGEEPMEEEVQRLDLFIKVLWDVHQGNHQLSLEAATK